MAINQPAIGRRVKRTSAWRAAFWKNMAFDRNAALWWGIWIGLIPLMSFLVTPRRQFVSSFDTVDTRYESPAVLLVTALGVALGIVPAVLTMLRHYISVRLAVPVLLAFFPIFFFITISLLAVANLQLRDIFMVGLVGYVIGLFLILAMQIVPTSNLARTLMSSSALFQALILIVVLLDSDYISGRFQGRIGPNYWGGVAAYTLLASLFIRNIYLRGSVILICLYTLMVSQNRTGMIALTAGISFLTILYFLITEQKSRLKIMLVAVGVLIASILFWPIIASDLLLLDSASRGVDSGGTGRFEAWNQAIAVIAQNPFFGVGYRHHEDYITAASSAHNAYLATFADLGLFGFLAWVVLLFGSLIVAVVKGLRARDQSYFYLAAIIFAYAVQGIFEQRGLNFANSVSLIVFVAMTLALRGSPRNMPVDVP